MPRISKRKLLPNGKIIVGFQVCPDQWKDLGKIAIDQDTSRSALLSEILAEFLAGNHAGKTSKSGSN